MESVSVEQIEFQSITVTDKGQYIVQIQPGWNLVFLESQIVCLEDEKIPEVQNVHHPLGDQEKYEEGEVPVENRNSNLQYITETYYQCQICNKIFSQKGNLIRHRKIHSGDKPFSCNLCGHKCSQKANLEKHMAAHNDNKKFQCEVCDKGFVQKVNLVRHRKIHTGEKPFKCDKCSKTFIQKGHLDKHLKLHCSADKYACDFCGIELESHSAKLIHQNRDHGVHRTKTDNTEIKKRPINLYSEGCPAVFRTQKQQINHKKFHE